MAIEKMRGCGYRKVGGLYLCGGGTRMNCDRLPYELAVCPTCGAGVKFTRGFTWLDWSKYAGGHKEPCRDVGNKCPVCHPLTVKQPYGLVWVGEQYYSPESFIEEALTLGVSRRIAAIPRNLKLGETWVLFAHKHVVPRSESTRHLMLSDIAKCPTAVYLDRMSTTKPGSTWTPETDEAVTGSPGVFYAFRPRRLELLVWESEATVEKLEELEKKGITPIIIPDGDVDHDPKTKLIPTDDERRQVESERDFARMRDAVNSILS